MDSAWSGDGPYQGYWMASVTGGGSQIIASCGMSEAYRSSIRLCINGSGQTQPDFSITVDNEKPYDITFNHYHNDEFSFERDFTLASKESFDKLVDDMSRGSQITIVNTAGESATFTLKGAAKALSECSDD
jgi:hypothetical protein